MPTGVSIRILILLMLMAATSGCASLLSKTSYPVAIQSSPAGANFVVKDLKGRTVASGTTPQTVTLPAKQGYFRRGDYQVQFEKSGYVGDTVALKGSLDSWYFGNVVLGGALGMLVIDPATGAMWKLPDAVSTALASNPAEATVADGVQQASHTESADVDPVELH